MTSEPRCTVSACTLAVVFLLAVACSSDDLVGVDADLTGTYELESLQFGDQPPVGPPMATGTLVLTEDDRYTVDLQISFPGNEQEIHDTGVFTVSGNTWTQESSVDGTQSVGTVTFDGTTLTVAVVVQGQEITNVWNRVGE